MVKRNALNVFLTCKLMLPQALSICCSGCSERYALTRDEYSAWLAAAWKVGGVGGKGRCSPWLLAKRIHNRLMGFLPRP